MARKLNTYVYVDGTRYGPEDDVPAEVQKKITNPDVWADDGETASDAAGDGKGSADVDPNRPKGNASRDAWAAYAASLDPPVQVSDEMGRDDIIAAVDKR